MFGLLCGGLEMSGSPASSDGPNDGSGLQICLGILGVLMGNMGIIWIEDFA